jgi:hypothetical protein
MYIVEYEQKGQDRANYGDAVIKEIAKRLRNSKIKGLSFTNLNIFRQFYLLYPQIIQTVSEQLIPADILVNSLSFSHFVELIKCEDKLQRTFYELESIKGTWAVRELKQLLQKEIKYINKI